MIESNQPYQLLQDVVSILLIRKNLGPLHPLGFLGSPKKSLQKKKMANFLSHLKIFSLEKIEAVVGLKMLGIHPPKPPNSLDGEHITRIYGFQFQDHTCGKKNTTKIPTIKAVSFPVGDLEKSQKFHPKKTSLTKIHS